MQLVAHCGRSMVRGAIRCRIRRCRRPFFLRWECVLPRNLQISVPSPCRVHDETRGAQTPTREGFSSRRLSSRLPSTHSSNVLCGLRCSSRKSLHTLDEKATTQSHPNLQCSPWSHRVRHHVVDVHAFQSLHLSQVSSTSVSAKRLKVRVATYMESARRQTAHVTAFTPILRVLCGEPSVCHPYFLIDASVQELIERRPVGVNASCGHLWRRLLSSAMR